MKTKLDAPYLQVLVNLPKIIKRLWNVYAASCEQCSWGSLKSELDFVSSQKLVILLVIHQELD
jgi:hypothetical protein